MLSRFLIILCFKVKNYEYQAQQYEKINLIS